VVALSYSRWNQLHIELILIDDDDDDNDIALNPAPNPKNLLIMVIRKMIMLI